MIFSKLRNAIFAAWFLFINPCMLASEKNAVITSNVSSEQTIETRTISFINNLSDATIMLDLTESQLIALDQVLKKAEVFVNNVQIKEGEAINLPVMNNNCTISVNLDAQAAYPFLKTTGLVKFLFNFVEFQLTFDQKISNKKDELYILFPIIAKCEEWEKKIPSVTLSYKFPHKVKVSLSDFKP